MLKNYLDRMHILLNNLAELWEDALVSVFHIHRKDEQQFMEHLSSDLIFDRELFSDYTESIRMPDDSFLLEIHHEYGYVLLVKQTKDEETKISEKRFIKDHKDSLDGAIKVALYKYIEYKREERFKI